MYLPASDPFYRQQSAAAERCTVSWRRRAGRAHHDSERRLTKLVGVAVAERWARRRRDTAHGHV